MKKFIHLYDGKINVNGTGYYENINMDYYIETNDSELIRYFKSKIRSKQHLDMLELTSENKKITISGSFLVGSIEGNNPTIIHYIKLIYLYTHKCGCFFMSKINGGKQ